MCSCGGWGEGLLTGSWGRRRDRSVIAYSRSVSFVSLFTLLYSASVDRPDMTYTRYMEWALKTKQTKTVVLLSLLPEDLGRAA